LLAHHEVGLNMTFASILAVASGADDDEHALRQAAHLASRDGAVVQVLLALPTEVASILAETFGGAALAIEATQAIARANVTTQAQVAAMARRVAEDLGLGFGADGPAPRIQMAIRESTTWLSLLAQTSLCDLVVIGARTAAGEGFWDGVPAEVLMASRLPLLVVRGEVLPMDRVAIAWDGSHPAGRAVKAALPLLKAAHEVIILQDEDGLTPAEMAAGCPECLKAYLALRGIEHVTTLIVTGPREGERLLTAAKRARADLLVAGAYGHTRLGEALFGGATRAFVEARSGPHLLLAH
jgi:nucleotide-binding universal stress UspA family protein